MKRKWITHSPISIPPPFCPICGKGRNQYISHDKCSKEMQRRRIERERSQA